MSDDLGNNLPDDLYDTLLNEDVTISPGKAILINTSDTDGWPHPALLSYREVWATGRNTIRIQTYNGTNTTRNLQSNGIITLIFIDSSMTYYVKGSAKEITSPSSSKANHLSVMDISITQILKDFTSEDEAGAYITTGITFHNPWQSKRQT
tara:strand:+ start:21429 stop:21881 length:453 start_codon:yes stop_codon:yes gene_type:complete